jgi:hypothetical protein
MAVSDPNLTVHAAELMDKLVAAWEQAPPDKRFSFGVSPGANRYLSLYHAGLPGGYLGTSWRLIGELEHAGLLERDDDPHPISQYRLYFSVTTKGIAYVRQRRNRFDWKWFVEKVLVPIVVAAISAGILSLIIRAFLETR